MSRRFVRLTAAVAASLCSLALACSKPRGIEPGLGLAPAEEPGLRGAFESMPLAGDARVTPLFRNVDAWAERWRLLEGAKESIDVVTFILYDDLFGRSFLGLLAKKADEGVRVRLLVDSTGTMSAKHHRVPEEAFAALARRPNVDVRAYNPIALAVPDALTELSLLPVMAANHDKLILVDGKHSVVGGRNFADEYFADPADDPVVFHDKDVLIESQDVATALTKVLEREWFDKSTKIIEPGNAKPADLDAAEVPLVAAAKAMGELLRDKKLKELPPPVVAARVAPVPAQREPLADPWQEILHFPRMRGALRDDTARALPAEVRVLDSCSQAGCRKNDINTGLTRLMNAAVSEVVIENPYLMLTNDGLKVMREAALRGVKITLLTNSPVSSDNAITQAVFLEQWPILVASVPNIELYVMAESHNVHGKMVAIDGKVSAIGSYNLDVISAALNSEVVTVMWSEKLAAAVKKNIMATIARGPPHVLRYEVLRDAAGKPLRDDDGKPMKKFGAEQHCDPSAWNQLTMVQSALKVSDVMPDLTPLL